MDDSRVRQILWEAIRAATQEIIKGQPGAYSYEHPTWGGWSHPGGSSRSAATWADGPNSIQVACDLTLWPVSSDPSQRADQKFKFTIERLSPPPEVELADQVGYFTQKKSRGGWERVSSTNYNRVNALFDFRNCQVSEPEDRFRFVRVTTEVETYS